MATRDSDLYKRAILVKGFGEGPIPVNTLYTEPQTLFADPLHPPASASNLATTGVNRDTLITIGWLDLSKGPQVLHVPDMNGRYYSVQFTNPSNNTVFAYVGRRTTGTEAGDYLITGPKLERTGAGWRETDILAEQLGACSRPSPRRERQRPANRPSTRRTDSAHSAKQGGIDMSARTYSYLAVLIAGVIVFFVINSFIFSPNPRTLFQDVVQGFFVGFGLAYITLQILGRVKATKINGWTTMFRCGEPGTGILSRAACALVFAGPINAPQEAMYWTTDVDGAGHVLSGEHDYTMHFPAGQLPPNEAFWSLTMGSDNNRFVPNPINRYSVGDRSGLVPNADGSVDIFIQNVAPVGHKSNSACSPPGWKGKSPCGNEEDIHFGQSGARPRKSARV